jgi:DNA invertase Pin-like site-specific DNA recombinase
MPSAGEPIRAAQYLRVSDDHQRASMPAQRAEITQFAAAHGYEVVRTYADTGKSGLRLEGRKALQRLLADVLGGQRDFRAILVQDVSRWGRFQDPDEAAHYEFLCRQAGVEVRYCMDSFENDLTPASALIKSLKRLMAAEFSRDLSRKTRAAKARLAAAGYWQGGAAGFGLRRCAVSPEGFERGRLGPGEPKLLESDRIVLARGPPDEQEIVRRIYRLYLRRGLSYGAIARRLNNEGVLTDLGRHWRDQGVLQVLSNAKYAGVYVYGREVQNLRGPRLKASPDDWIRVEKVFAAVISPAIFRAVQARRRRQRRAPRSETEMLAAAARLLVRHGQLTAALLNDAPGVSHANSYQRHFGARNRLYARLGYYPDHRARCGRGAPRDLSGYIIDPVSLEPLPFVARIPTMSSLPALAAYTAFAGDHLIATGRLAEVALAVKTASDGGATMILVFQDATGAVVDLDLRGDAEEVLGRLPSLAIVTEDPAPARAGRGRPKLGVTAREVTLLPRHWDWLSRQPGGASAALRRLVEQAARHGAPADAAREAQTAAYKVMYALAGHLKHFEEASRALYADDFARLTDLTTAWPEDIGDYVRRLASLADERQRQMASSKADA